MLNKLQKMRQNLKKKGKGFTLVELIVVIIIIAIIAAVALPRISAFQENARKSRIQSEHRQLVTAVQSYIAQSADPVTAYESINSIDDLKPYMNIKDDKTVTEATEKDNKQPAHTIENHKLVSKYTSPDNDTKKNEVWEYDLAPKTNSN